MNGRAECCWLSLPMSEVGFDSPSRQHHLARSTEPVVQLVEHVTRGARHLPSLGRLRCRYRLLIALSQVRVLPGSLLWSRFPLFSETVHSQLLQLSALLVLLVSQALVSRA